MRRKQRHIIALLIGLAFLTACDTTTREARRMVKRAERLADTLPDSTVSLIDSVLRMPANFSERERMDIALLQAEALFGCRDGACTVSTNTISPLMDDDFFDNHATISTSPELERAAAYYARKRQYAKAAHAALYSGFVQQHYNEKEAAMRSFKEAEQYGKLAVDSLTVVQAEYWMGKMLIDDGMEQEALDLLQAASLGFGNHFVDKALVMNMMGVCYILQGDVDNAEICLKNSLAYGKKENSFKVKKKVLNNYAVLYRLLGKYDDAIYCLRQIADGANLTNTEETLLYLNLGKTFEANGEIDSAFLYYQRLEETIPIVAVKNETKVSVYGALSQFAEKQGDIQTAIQHKEHRENLLSVVLEERQEQAIYRIQQQYDYESLQNEMNRKLIRKQHIITLFGILTIIGLAVLAFSQIRLAKIRKQEAEMKRQIDDLKNDLRDSVKTSYLEQELSSRLRLILAAYRAHKKAYDPNKEWSSIAFKLMNGKEKLFDAVLEEMEKVYPDIYTVLRQKYPELNETETKVCLLSCSDLSNMEMAEILGMSKYTIDKNRSKLRDKLNLKPERMKEQLHKAISH